MKVKAIRETLGNLCLGVNLYPGEPSSHHCVSVRAGTAKQAIVLITAAGDRAWHGLAWGPYSESISVERD
jgi:hypothetical protein